MNNALQTIFKNAFERFTGFLSVIQSDHAYIHQGLAFKKSLVIDLTGSQTKNCYFVTPPENTGKYIHWRPLVFNSSTSGVQVFFYENGNYSGGDELASFNLNRNSTNVASMEIFDGTPTITTTGDLLLTDIVGGTGTPSRVSGGSGAGSDEEIILKADTKYLVRVTNLTSTATKVAFSFFWYEESTGV